MLVYIFNFYEFDSIKKVYGKENYLRFLEQIKEDEKEIGYEVLYSLRVTKINDYEENY